LDTPRAVSCLSISSGGGGKQRVPLLQHPGDATRRFRKDADVSGGKRQQGETKSALRPELLDIYNQCLWRPVAEPDEDKLELEPGEGKTVHRLFRIPLTFEATQKNIPNCWLNEKPTKAIKSYLSNKTHAAYLTLGQDVSLRYIYTNKIVYNYPPMEVLLPPPSDNQTEFSNDDAQKIERMDLEYLVARVFCARLAVVVGCLPCAQTKLPITPGNEMPSASDMKNVIYGKVITGEVFNSSMRAS